MKEQAMNNDRVVNVLFCGTGGQGVLKAAEVCGWAAVLDGYHTKKSEVHGMAQRGGSVESHLRFGAAVLSPLIPPGRADFLVSFDEGEHERLKGFLAPDGTDLIDRLAAARTRAGDRRYVNTYLLGVLSRRLPISEASWLAALEKVFPARSIAENRKVFLDARAGA